MRVRRGSGHGQDERQLLDGCHTRAVELLQRNLTTAGILAASPGARAERRGYSAIFGRDAAICAIGMALSGDERLRREAARGLATLARHQAANGQIPKFVDVRRREADFWYLGCIDATLWWLIAVAFLDARGEPRGLARDREEAPAVCDIADRPDRAGLELRALLQRAEVELEILPDGLSDERAASRAAELHQRAFVDGEDVALVVDRHQRLMQEAHELRPAVKAQDPRVTVFVEEIPP